MPPLQPYPSQHSVPAPDAIDPHTVGLDTASHCGTQPALSPQPTQPLPDSGEMHEMKERIRLQEALAVSQFAGEITDSPEVTQVTLKEPDICIDLTREETTIQIRDDSDSEPVYKGVIHTSL